MNEPRHLGTYGGLYAFSRFMLGEKNVPGTEQVIVKLVVTREFFQRFRFMITMVDHAKYGSKLTEDAVYANRLTMFGIPIEVEKEND